MYGKIVATLARGTPLATVGVRQLKDHLSDYLRRAREGELVVISDRGKPIAELGPVERAGSIDRARTLVRQGVARWSGGKPKGLAGAPRPRRGLVSDAVIEDRG
jgi:prevent-host-death family protein